MNITNKIINIREKQLSNFSIFSNFSIVLNSSYIASFSTKSVIYMKKLPCIFKISPKSCMAELILFHGRSDGNNIVSIHRISDLLFFDCYPSRSNLSVQMLNNFLQILITFSLFSIRFGGQIAFYVQLFHN